MAENKNIKGSITSFNTYHTDAYMIAVKNGFEGTEAEWLESLRARSTEEAIAAANRAMQGEKNVKAAEESAKANVKEAEDEAVAHLTSLAEGAYDIVQTPGDSETQVMSQEAVTKELDNKADKIDERSINRFNPDDATDDCYFNVNNGTLVSSESPYVSAYVKLVGAGEYVTRVSTLLYGVLQGSNLAVFDKNKTYIGTVHGTLTEGTDTKKHDAELLVNIDIDGACYVGLTVVKALLNEIMFVKGSEYPTEYIPYSGDFVRIPNLIIDNLPMAHYTGNSKELAMSQKGVTDLFNVVAQMSKNLYDANSDDIQIGVYVLGDGSIATANNYQISGAIPVKKNTTYTLTKSQYIADAILGGQYTENGEFLDNIEGTLSSDRTYVTFTTVDDEELSYIKINTANDTHLSCMFVEGSEYPSEYIPYRHTLTENFGLNEKQKSEAVGLVNNNPLSGKKLSANGDSICYGAGYAGGYAKIIGENNGMTVQNIGVGGGTITAETYTDAGKARHWISQTVDSMDADADYAILEGGVNDAGRKDPLGTLSNNFSGDYDTTTFYGAFEYMLYRLVTRFAGKKYGYIAVHQMVSGYRVSDDEATSYYWAAKKCCEKWGVPFLDLNISCPPFAFLYGSIVPDDLTALKTTYTHNGDGWHPNEEGYKKYYVPKIEAWLKTL